MLQIYNTLTRKKEEFKPITDGEVKLYVCGMTVYDYCHIGHARSMLTFDVVVRYLRARGYDVTYVRNITDIDDKIIKRAQERGVDFMDVVEEFIAAMNEDAAKLDILPPDIEPRATEYVEKIITLTENLIEQGYAYQTSDGDVCYRVEKFDGYGKLSNRKLDELEAGTRTDVQDTKDHPLDFVLWKHAKPGEPSWPSPWGEGRPGWHIECSAMSMDTLGENFDIHGGGLDLKFPHHENEIAQSEAATHKPYANLWMHAGLVQVNSEKMSKSLNNFFTIRDVLAQFSPEVVRFFMLSSHYRSPVDYSEEALQNAQAGLERFYLALRDVDTSQAQVAQDSEYQQRFYAAMDDDFNTSVATAVLFDMARELNKLKDSEATQAANLAAELKHLAGILGLLQNNAEDFFQAGQDADEVAKIEDMIAQRNAARANKDYAEADRLRDDLLAMGIVIEDSQGVTKWRKT